MKQEEGKSPFRTLRGGKGGGADSRTLVKQTGRLSGRKTTDYWDKGMFEKIRPMKREKPGRSPWELWERARRGGRNRGRVEIL